MPPTPPSHSLSGWQNVDKNQLKHGQPDVLSPNQFRLRKFALILLIHKQKQPLYMYQYVCGECRNNHCTCISMYAENAETTIVHVSALSLIHI